MAIPKNTDFITGSALPAIFLNRVEEILSPLAINAELSISGTSVFLTCGTGDTACVLGVGGKLRWSEATKSVNLAGQPANTYGIWATTTADDNDASFTMSYSVAPPGGTYIRQLGSVVWSGSALSGLKQIVGYEKHGFMHLTEDPLPALSVAISQLTALAQEALVPAGSITGTGRTTAPAGYLLCDGAAVSRATYAALFAAIGTTYGVGDGVATFNIPDGRGRTMVMVDGAAARLTANDALGNSGGFEKHTIAEEQLPVHSHTAVVTGNQVPSVQNLGGGGNVGNFSTPNSGVGVKAPTAQALADQWVSSVYTGAIGGNQAHNNMQPFFVGNWIIKT